MVHCTKIKGREVIVEGVNLYKKTFFSFLKYAFYAVLLSYASSIYVLFLQTFLDDSPFLYVIGMALMVLLYIVFIYFSVRVTMNSVMKLRAIIENKPYPYKDNFKNTEHKFWRAFFVIVIRGIVQLTLMVCIILFMEIIGGPLIGGFALKPYFILPLAFVGLLMAYLAFRLEFALLTVFWDLNIKHSDFKSSFLITKKQKLTKFLIVCFAQIPWFINLLFHFFTQWYKDFEFANTGYVWGGLLLSIVINTIIFSWSYSIYYVMLSKMGYMDFTEKVFMDEEGREWVRF